MVRLILGDQLNRYHTWFSEQSDDVTYAFFECYNEATYAPHHIQKIVGIFAGMRAFASALQAQGHKVHYGSIGQTLPSLGENLQKLCTELNTQRIEIQQPDEYRVQEQLLDLRKLGLQIEVCSSEHFIADVDDFKTQFSGKKTLLMESFYRRMRKYTGIFMQGAQPLGGKWNYDASNRKALPKGHSIPPRYFPDTDVRAIVADIQQANIPTIGSLGNREHFYWPTTPEQAKDIFHYWLKHDLPFFGDFQDAMARNQWAMYHSRISFALNTKMINPLWVCQEVERAYHEREEVSINAAEGFIRQILGWREFMRGAYWMAMPDYESLNYFNHNTPLPSWFWTGKTKMECMKQSIGQSLDHAYAHHIQRLMITGNFMLLAGIDPSEVDRWYLGIYIDAFQWVEITNTRGMSQFADGGWIATKPYVSSANYIHKMSDYCAHCPYDRKTRAEKDSCPFNALYWDFYEKNEGQLRNNPRIGMVYRTLNKMKEADKVALRERARWIHDHLENL